MIELIVCDLAGTTVSDGDGVAAAFRAALASHGIEAEAAAISAVMGLPKPEAIRILLEEYGRPRGVLPTSETIESIHVAFTTRMCDYYASDPAVCELPGASLAFAAFRAAGVKVALNTGFFRTITDVLLYRLGWTVPDIVDAVVTSDEVPRGRPHPDMIRHLMAKLGIGDARRVAKVGDTKADLEEGTNAGCGLVIGVTTGSFTRVQLEAFPHTHIVDSIAEVPALVLGRSFTR